MGSTIDNSLIGQYQYQQPPFLSATAPKVQPQQTQQPSDLQARLAAIDGNRNYVATPPLQPAVDYGNVNTDDLNAKTNNAVRDINILNGLGILPNSGIDNPNPNGELNHQEDTNIKRTLAFA